MFATGVSRLVSGVVVWLTLVAPAAAATVSVAWNANPEPDITGYNVYVSTQPGVFGNPIAIGNRTTWTFSNLQAGVQYYFAVQALSPGGASGLAQIGHVPAIPPPAGSENTRSDFNGDGRFDLLWQNQQNGQLMAWHMSGAAIVGTRFLSPSAVSPDWKLRGTGDLNADGKADIVWQNTVTGEIAFYLMDGTLAFATGMFNPSRVDPTWQIASVRDMDRDGHPDILWNNVNTGQVLAWFMNGTIVARQGWINATPLADPNWRLRGTGDFDGDGLADLVWQHEGSGQPLLWKMNGPSVVSAMQLPTPGTPDWKIMAIGDANVDGHTDLIFQNAVNGGIVIWAMNRTNVYSGPYIGAVDPAWKISSPR
jgi:hypothetical protein